MAADGAPRGPHLRLPCGAPPWLGWGFSSLRAEWEPLHADIIWDQRRGRMKDAGLDGAGWGGGPAAGPREPGRFLDAGHSCGRNGRAVLGQRGSNTHLEPSSGSH